MKALLKFLCSIHLIIGIQLVAADVTTDYTASDVYEDEGVFGCLNSNATCGSNGIVTSEDSNSHKSDNTTNGWTLLGDTAGNKQTYPLVLTQFEMTIEKIELFESLSGEWKTLSETSVTVDFTDATAANSVAGAMTGASKLPNGIYTESKVTTGSTIKIKACNQAGNICTNGSLSTKNESAFYGMMPILNGSTATTTTIAIPSGDEELITSIDDTNGNTVPCTITDNTQSINLGFYFSLKPIAEGYNETSSSENVLVMFNPDYWIEMTAN